MRQRKSSLIKYFEYLVYSMFFGALVITYINYSSSKRYFESKTTKSIKNNAIKISYKIDDILVYVENVTNIIASRISEQKEVTPYTIARTLKNVRPKIDDRKYDIFTWTLFDFVSPNGKVIATSSGGVVKENLMVQPEERSWMTEAKTRSWKLLVSKSDVGIVSGQTIIPLGFGITDKKNEFLGIISLGIDTNRLKETIEPIIDSEEITFLILNEDNSIITTSDNFGTRELRKLKKEIFKDLSRKISTAKNKFIKLDGRKFYYSKIPNYPRISVLVSYSENLAQSRFNAEIIPNIANTFYLTTFFLILLHLLNHKLLQPVIRLSEIANKISKGKTDVHVPKSNLSEINFLADSIETVRGFIENQKKEAVKLSQEKKLAEEENKNKTEFLSSTVHELKNITAGITGLAEIIKQNLNNKFNSENKDLTKKEILENQEFLDDIVKLGHEISDFVHDVIDINQARTGNFKIEEQSVVDLKDVVLRSIKLLRIRAIKNKKQIITNFVDHEGDEDFIIRNLDPRRVKQIYVNLISNAIKYGYDDSKIEIRLEKIDQEASDSLKSTLIKNIKENSDIDIDRKPHLINIIKKYRPKIITVIKDKGPGMSEDEIRIALQKYGRIKHQEERSNKSDSDDFFDSTGLGLPIVKYLVEMQGGMMIISSQEDVGTEIRVIF